MNDHDINSAETIRIAFEHVQSERLILRAPTSDDVSSLFEIHRDPATNQYNPHGPMKNLDQATARLQEWQHHWACDGFGYWSILLPDHPEIIGFGGLHRIRLADQEVLNLYYRFSTDSWGQGYATELAHTAIAIARKYLPDLCVVARISPVNKPSIKVAERVGMALHPELSDDEYNVFAI